MTALFRGYFFSNVLEQLHAVHNTSCTRSMWSFYLTPPRLPSDTYMDNQNNTAPEALLSMPLMLPGSSEGGLDMANDRVNTTRQLDVQTSQSIRLDDLGPMVVNSDGVSRLLCHGLDMVHKY